MKNNYWTRQSIEFAQQKNYLDELFKVYPLNPNLRRELSKSQGVPILKDSNKFLNADENCILNSSDNSMQIFAKDFLGFTRYKGVDFLAKFNNKYIVGEAKFLTDFGGHQNAQFNDALSSIHSFKGKKQVNNEVIPVTILDGVLYIKGKNKMHEYIINHHKDNIFSALVLREFLYSL